MRSVAVISAFFVLSLASAQTFVPFPDLSPEKQQAQCADIEKRNVERMQQGLHAVYPWEELCYSAKTFDFTNKPNPERLRQIVMLLRTVMQMTEKQISADPEASTITLHAAPGKVEMVGWVLRELDLPPFSPGKRAESASAHELPVPRTEQDQPGRNDEILRVFALAHTDTPRGYQEILTVLRTVADVQKVSGDSDQLTFVIRAPAPQMKLAAYLISALDVVPGSTAASAEFPYKAPDRPFARPLPSADTAPPDVVRVFYPAHATSPKAVQQIVNALRTVVGIQKLFWDTSAAAIPVRGTPADIAAATWLIQALDIPAEATAASPTDREFQLPGVQPDVLRVFYLGQKTTPEGLKAVLAQLGSDSAMKVASNATPPALIVRGSAATLAQAEPSILAGLLTTP